MRLCLKKAVCIMITTIIVLTHCFNFAPMFLSQGSSNNSIVDVEPTPADEAGGEQNGNESEIVEREEGFDDETITDIDEVVDNENDVPATTEPVEDEEYQLENEIEPLADNASVCNFVVSGGELGTDYQCNGVVLEIKTSTPLTIKTAGYDNTNGDAAKTQEVFKSKVYKDVEEGFRYYNYLDLSGQATFEEYISKVKDNSLYDTGVSAKYSDQILTLSTCSYHEKDGRFVVVAKKVSESNC